jgi:hypothetical protein
MLSSFVLKRKSFTPTTSFAPPPSAPSSAAAAAQQSPALADARPCCQH